jgi:hypothetical protein
MKRPVHLNTAATFQDGTGIAGYEQQLLVQYSCLGMCYVTALFIRQTLRRETMIRHHERLPHQTCRVF